MDFNSVIKLFSPITTAPITSGYPNYTPVSGAISYLPSIVNFVVNLLFYIGGVAVVIAIIWGGIMYITAAGDASKAERARSTILYAIIGMIVIIMSFAIIKIVVRTVS